MKVVLIVFVLAVAGWFFYGCWRTQAPAAETAAPSPNVVERYGQSLADDVKKADEVRVKANAAIVQAEDARKAFEQAEPASPPR